MRSRGRAVAASFCPAVLAGLAGCAGVPSLQGRTESRASERRSWTRRWDWSSTAPRSPARSPGRSTRPFWPRLTGWRWAPGRVLCARQDSDTR